MYQRVSVAGTSHLIQEKNPLIFDVRDAASYQAAHLPNAVFLSDRTLKSTIRQTARDRAILVYCYRGNASQDIARLFSDFGFREVYSLDGGFESWRKELPERVSSAPLVPKIPQQPLESWLAAQGFDPADLETRVAGATPLIKACQLGLAWIAEALIAAGASLDGLDGYGNDALWAACFSGDLATLEIVLKAGAKLNRANPGGNTALIYAASAGKAQVVARLLQAGADASRQNADGFTALDLAANLETLRLLKQAGKTRKPASPPAGSREQNAIPS